MNNVPTEVQAFVMEIARIVIPIIVTFILGLVGDLLLKARREYESRVSLTQRAVIEAAVAVGVQAAEQSGLAGYIQNEGQSKLAYAVVVAQRQLDAAGLTGVNATTLKDYIESALRQGLHQRPTFLTEASFSEIT